METLLRFFVGCFLALALNNLQATENEAENELVILNERDHIAPRVIKTFENQYQAHLKIVTFSSAHERDKYLRQQPNDFDLVLLERQRTAELSRQRRVSGFGCRKNPEYATFKKNYCLNKNLLLALLSDEHRNPHHLSNG